MRWLTRDACWACARGEQLFIQRQQRTQLEAKVQELEDAYFSGGVKALQSTLSAIGSTGYTQRVRVRVRVAMMARACTRYHRHPSRAWRAM